QAAHSVGERADARQDEPIRGVDFGRVRTDDNIVATTALECTPDAVEVANAVVDHGDAVAHHASLTGMPNSRAICRICGNVARRWCSASAIATASVPAATTSRRWTGSPKPPLAITGTSTADVIARTSSRSN